MMARIFDYMNARLADYYALCQQWMREHAAADAASGATGIGSIDGGDWFARWYAVRA